MDIVNILRQLRNTKFLANRNIKMYQQNMMHFNEEYCVGDPEAGTSTDQQEQILYVGKLHEHASQYELDLQNQLISVAN